MLEFCRWRRLPPVLMVPRPYMVSVLLSPLSFFPPFPLRTRKSCLFTFSQRLVSAIFIDIIKRQLRNQILVSASPPPQRCMGKHIRVFNTYCFCSGFCRYCYGLFCGFACLFASASPLCQALVIILLEI